MATELRKSGIDVVGDMPWGTHFCQFFDTKDDLLEVLVPFIKAGLESNEACLWVVSTVSEQDARNALRPALPDLERYLANQSLEIQQGREWYINGGVLDLDKVKIAWSEKTALALARGYAGLRVTGDTFWLKRDQWRDFNDYEEEFNRSIRGLRMNCLCSYPLTVSGATDILDAAHTHQFTVARRKGSWEVVETAQLKRAKSEIKRLNEELEQRVIERTRELAGANEQLKRALEEIACARDAALEASRLKSAFIANMSHEIRTPLNLIAGYTDLIGDYLAEQGDESQKDHEEAIERACSRLSRTIDNILDISKIEAGALKPVPRQLELGRLLEHLLADFRVVAEGNGIALTCTLDTLGAIVVFDEYCLTQALTNLLDNALKFTERGEVACRLYRGTDAGLCLEIRDTGIGISQEYLTKLFQPFSQEQKGDARKFQGSGLGLALTRKYLELNGAEISVHSEKGKGATFIIHFSREGEPGKGSDPHSIGEPKGVTSRATILVVEDDAETQAYMRAILRRQYDVVIAASGAETRKVLEVQPDVSLILMDVALGGDEDGLALVRHLRADERWKLIPTVALTAFAAPEDRERAHEAGFDDYLAKPVTRRELLAKIETLLMRPRSA